MSDHAYPDALPSQYRLHWYVLERVLGQGGFGITYLARDTNLDQAVAIKEYLPVEVATRRADSTVRPRSDDQNERYRWGLDRFIREARTLARFDHPNIVRVLSVFEFNGTAYMVMRFEEGENFAALLERRRTLPEAELMRVLFPVLDGLELIHNAGFIHRDIKPDNIHIRADGSPVLLDFGSARGSLSQGRTVTILVAPGYAPFEQYYSTGENQGPWTDLYGLGATCYRAIAGVPPLDAITRSKGVLGSAREVLVPARTIGAGRYSQRVLRAIDRALEFAEKDRPQTIAAWRKELTAEAPTAPVERAPAVVSTPQPQADPAAPVVPPPAPAARPKLAGIRGPLLGAVAGALAAAVALGVWFRPAADEQRLQDLERKLEEQRRKDDETARRAQEDRERIAKEQAAKEQTAREQAVREQQRKNEEEQKLAAAERERIARDEEQRAQARKREEDRQRLTKVQKPEKPSTALAQPTRAVPPTAKDPQVAVAQPTPAVPAPVTPPPASSPPAPAPPSETARADHAPAPAPRKAPLVVPKNDSEAFAFYRKLALQGDAEARATVGDMYANGRGVTQNINNAYIWYGLAVKAGNAAARDKQEQMAVKLQPAEIRQADHTIERLASPVR